MEPNFEYVVDNGIKLSGPLSSMIEMLKKCGVDLEQSGEYYYSSSKKTWLKVADMNDVYCRNAFMKLLQKRVAEFVATAKPLSNEKFIQHFIKFGKDILNKDKTLMNMLFRIREADKSFSKERDQVNTAKLYGF